MKTELLKTLFDSGQSSKFSYSPEWEKAFEAYKKDTGDLRVGYRCGSCYRKVLKWLRK